MSLRTWIPVTTLHVIWAIPQHCHRWGASYYDQAHDLLLSEGWTVPPLLRPTRLLVFTTNHPPIALPCQVLLGFN
ncbi:hypothetical protein BC826DRAFT_1012655 [Russula brevipes]|nr:hypothetical protein BC826DRAFT_1012655 [Russula brevipes]